MPEDPNERSEIYRILANYYNYSANFQIMREAARAFANFGEDFSRGELLETASEFQITKNLRETGRILEMYSDNHGVTERIVAKPSELQRTFANFGDMANSGEPL